jgi:hypothetical protein
VIFHTTLLGLEQAFNSVADGWASFDPSKAQRTIMRKEGGGR